MVRRGRQAAAYRDIEADNCYGFLILDNDGEPLAEHAIRYNTPQQRDEAREACIAYLRGLVIEPYLIADSFFLPGDRCQWRRVASQRQELASQA